MSALLRRDGAMLAVFGIAYAAVTMLVENSYHQLIMTVVPVWAVMALSWNLFSGYSGLVSFGHAAFFGLGAYLVALAHAQWGIAPWFSIPAAGVMGALAGVAVGAPTFRLRGHYFALAMLAYPMALLYVFEWLGYQELTIPMERTSPVAYMQFTDHRVYGLIALGLLLAAMAVTMKLERSRFGLSLVAIKQDEAAAEAAGIDARSWKLLALTLSGAMAAVAGGFYAVVLMVITPTAVFGMLASAQALILTMFGGVGTVWGPVIGAVILVPLSELLRAKLSDSVPGIEGTVYGLAIIAVILLAPEGVFWKLRDLVLARERKRAPAEPAPVATETEAAPVPVRTAGGDAPVILEVRNLSRAFGGLKAVQDVSFGVRRGEILGIIGPNGAGKTTLFNLLNGFLRPDTGEVTFEGRRVTGERPDRICAAGIGRTFQVVKPFRRMTVLDNVIVGAFVRAKSADQARSLAEQALAKVGMQADSGRLAGELSNRQLRLLELARALAGQPKLLLLDETLAGLGSQDAEAVVNVVRRLAADGLTVVIIEHTMPAMVKLVDRFLVLDHGAVLTSGLPTEVTRDPAVIDAYLGKRWRTANAGN